MPRMDRRLSRAVWSSKTPKAARAPPVARAPMLTIPGEEEEESGNESPEPSMTLKVPAATEAPAEVPFPMGHRRRQTISKSKPHRVDRAAHSRRFSVRMPRAEAPNFGSMMEEGINEGMDEEDEGEGGTGEKADLAHDIQSHDYEASAYLRKHLKNADAEEIDKFTTKLDDMNIENKNDIKRTITQSLNSVLTVSKSIGKTEEVLGALKKTVDSLNDVMYQQVEEAQDIAREREGADGMSEMSGSGGSGNEGRPVVKADKRRSVLILEKKWADNLTTLFKDVDGAQQFISVAPGRHVIAQSKRWGELNALTWKPIRPAHLIILNDYLLVATRKRVEDKKRTIATGCWPIREVTLEDAHRQDDDDTKKGFTIAFKTRGMSLLFQTDSLNEYNKVRVAFKNAKAECLRSAEAEDARNRSKNLRRSMNRLSSDRLNRNTEMIHDLSDQLLSHRRVRSREIRQQRRQKSIDEVLKSVDESFMNIEIYLGHHKYVESVGLVNRVREQLDALTRKDSQIVEQLDSASEEAQLKFLVRLKLLKLDDLRDKLVQALSWEVCDPKDSPQELAAKLDLFRNLGLEATGRKVLLESKTKELDELITSVKFEGNLQHYLLQVSILYFNVIFQVYALYEECFPNVKDKTFIIEWANERLSNYNKIFQRQLVDYEHDSEMYDSCLTIARKQSEQLKKLGMNVDYLLH